MTSGARSAARAAYAPTRASKATLAYKNCLIRGSLNATPTRTAGDAPGGEPSTRGGGRLCPLGHTIRQTIGPAASAGFCRNPGFPLFPGGLARHESARAATFRSRPPVVVRPAGPALDLDQ